MFIKVDHLQSSRFENIDQVSLFHNDMFFFGTQRDKVELFKAIHSLIVFNRNIGEDVASLHCQHSSISRLCTNMVGCVDVGINENLASS